ncbi:MAG: hypothetical protein AABX01_01570 [Candidatus Micrarchaeota archaeon]
MAKAQSSFEYILLLSGVLMVVVLVIIIVRGSIGDNQIRVQKLQCLSAISQASACFGADHSWDPNGCGIPGSGAGCLASKYYLPAKCLEDGGWLEGTPYKKDETHFYCSTRPV